MSYNMKSKNFLDFCKPTNKIKARIEQIVVLSRVLSNKTAMRNCVQLVLRDFETFWLLGMCKN